MRFEGDWTPQSPSENMTGFLGQDDGSVATFFLLLGAVILVVLFG